MATLKNSSFATLPPDHLSAEEVKIFYTDELAKGTEKGVLLLIHGFPETSYQFRHVIPLFAEAGYRVIAPDYRGAGYSSKPESGDVQGKQYTKVVMANDLFRIVTQTLGIKEKVHVVGHDIGGMVAHAYATRFAEHTASVTWGECPLPGSTAYEKNKGSVGLFHFQFHSVPDLPEALVTGREEIYLRHFYDKIACKPQAFTPADLAFYTYQYSRPGALRAGFNVYRAFEQDSKDNNAWLKKHGRVRLPSMILMGENSFLTTISESMASEYYEEGTYEFGIVKTAAHYASEEAPENFVEEVLKFVGKH